MTFIALFVGLFIGFGIAVTVVLPKACKLYFEAGVAAAQSKLAALLESMPEQDQNRFNALALEHMAKLLADKLGDV